ncbi:MAG TPA: substrate-binding domain-containing protein [Chloroflexota bacterium]|nr:substrate-binding domain-containing protein [Chloroflexota bacterium]
MKRGHLEAWLIAGLALLLSGCTATAVTPVGEASPRSTGGETPSRPAVLLATTTSVQDSGLLDVLVPQFERATGYTLKPIAVGTGQALALGARGEADVVLAHAPEAERAWMAEGHGTARLLVMYNDFLLVGPPDDPAGVRAAATATEALQRIAAARALWVSRGDQSGTHQLELQLWQAAGLAPAGQPWYQEVGQGMGQTLNIASEKGGYTLVDRGTWLARRSSLALVALREGGPGLRNLYHVLLVNPAKSPQINAAGAAAFAQWLVSPETQALIGAYGQDRFGEPLFVPAAGRSEAELAE